MTTDLTEALHAAVVADRLAVDRAAIAAAARDLAPLLPTHEIDTVVAAVHARSAGLGPLEPLLADPAVTDVMVNGPGPVWVERAGALVPTEVVLAERDVHLLVERITAPLGVRVDRRHPLGDGRLADGSRVHVAVPPAAIDGPYVTIRRFGTAARPLADLVPAPYLGLLRRAVRERRSILVVGATGSGKTTLLNALCQDLDPGERVVTIEDAAELRLPGDHVVRLEARTATADGVGAVSIRELVRNALRMRPDRIIVGEVRGAETLDMIQAMHTGHDGSMATCHANSPTDALGRLETMMLTADADLPLAAVRAQVHAAIDLVVMVARGANGARTVQGVHEVSPDPDATPRTSPLDGASPIRPARRVAP